MMYDTLNIWIWIDLTYLLTLDHVIGMVIAPEIGPFWLCYPSITVFNDWYFRYCTNNVFLLVSFFLSFFRVCDGCSVCICECVGVWLSRESAWMCVAHIMFYKSNWNTFVPKMTLFHIFIHHLFPVESWTCTSGLLFHLY